MDGILEELLRLEDAKHHALLALDPAVYEASVQKQSCLIDDPAIFAAAPTGLDTLLAFSKLARTNAILYENLLSTAPWIEVACRSYTGTGQIENPLETPGFSAEA
jgi:hypothetical protein